MTPYDEAEVLAFAGDLWDAYEAAGFGSDKGIWMIWVGRMQFDAVTTGYAAARAKHLAAVQQVLDERRRANDGL